MSELKVKIVNDFDPSNPRSEWDNLGTMVCRHRRYSLGDQNAEDILDAFEAMSEAEFREKVDDCLRKQVIALPMFMYDHSGITIATTPFSCPWDSGVIGYIYVTFEEARKQMGWKRLTAERKQKLEEYLRNEVQTYDDYVTGNVYGWQIVDEDDNVIDSCYGYYGDKGREHAEAEANDILEHLKTKVA